MYFMFHFEHSAKKLRRWFKFHKFFGFYKECTLLLHSLPKMSGAQSALFNFEMSGAHASLRFWECTREWRSKEWRSWTGCQIWIQNYFAFRVLILILILSVMPWSKIIWSNFLSLKLHNWCCYFDIISDLCSISL